jgi:hypothetical protein
MQIELPVYCCEKEEEENYFNLTRLNIVVAVQQREPMPRVRVELFNINFNLFV